MNAITKRFFRIKTVYEQDMAWLLAEVPGLDTMMQEFPIKSPVTQWYVMNAPDPDLHGLTPAHCLRRIMQIIRAGDIRKARAGYGKQEGEK